MFGQKSGLNSKIRSLIAKIQKEFNFPKVYAVRCRINTVTHTWRDLTRPAVNTLEPPRARVQSIRTRFEVNLRQGLVTRPEVRSETPLSQIRAEVHTQPCWRAETLTIHQPRIAFPYLRVHDVDVTTPEVEVNDQETTLPEIICLGLDFLKKPRVKSGQAYIEKAAIGLRLVPMSAISKKLLIRYRTSVLKSLNVSPNQVKFVGVCFSLPPVPLRILHVDPFGEDGGYVYARTVGEVNPYLGRRVWVLIQVRDRPAYLPITLKEE